MAEAVEAAPAALVLPLLTARFGPGRDARSVRITENVEQTREVRTVWNCLIVRLRARGGAKNRCERCNGCWRRANRSHGLSQLDVTACHSSEGRHPGNIFGHIYLPDTGKLRLSAWPHTANALFSKRWECCFSEKNSDGHSTEFPAQRAIRSNSLARRARSTNRRNIFPAQRASHSAGTGANCRPVGPERSFWGVFPGPQG